MKKTLRVKVECVLWSLDMLNKNEFAGIVNKILRLIRAEQKRRCGGCPHIAAAQRNRMKLELWPRMIEVLEVVEMVEGIASLKGGLSSVIGDVKDVLQKAKSIGGGEG